MTQTVQTVSHTAVRRRAVIENAVDEVAELLLGLFLGASRAPRTSWSAARDRGYEWSRRPAHSRSGPCHTPWRARFAGSVSSSRDILVHRCGERMVHGNEAVLLLAVLEQRELGYPQQLEVVLLRTRPRLAWPARSAARPEQRAAACQFASATTNSRSFSLAPARSLDGRNLVLGQELGKRRSHAAVCGELHPCQTLCTVGLDELAELVDLLAREACPRSRLR